MDNTYLAILLLIIIGLTLLRIPIYLTLLTATLFLQVYVNMMPLAGMYNAMIESTAKSSFLCIPYFVLAGSLMSHSSLGTRLVNLFVTLLKKTRGGFALASWFAISFFGAISGSSPATVATFAPIIYKPMEKLYGANMATGIITSSGALSIILPPSITLVIYGVVTNTSVARLFMAGFLPGIVIIFVIGTYLYIRCKPSTEEDIKSVTGEISVGKAIIESIPVLVMPIIILGGIYGGIFTPTEAAAVSALYACVASLLLRDIKIKELPGVLMNSCKTCAQVMVLIASACAFSQAVIVAQLPRAISLLFEGAGKIQFLLILNFILLVIGFFFEVGSAILILAPLLLPAAVSMGIDPVHLGIIFTVNLSIGMFTPPFGLNIFVVQSILGKGMGEISIAIIPYAILYFASCLIITYIPWISLVLPRLLM